MFQIVLLLVSVLYFQRVERALLVFEEAKDAGYLTAELWEKWVIIKLYSYKGTNHAAHNYS